MTLEKKNLYIPGRPDYIYYFDGATTKCYRKTGAKVYNDGIEFTNNQIASDLAQHQADPGSFPIVTYNSCVECQGIDQLFVIGGLSIYITPGDVATTVQVFDSQTKLTAIDIYDVGYLSAHVTAYEQIPGHQFFTDFPYTDSTAEYADDVPLLSAHRSILSVVTIGQFLESHEVFADIPVTGATGALSGVPIITISNDVDVQISLPLFDEALDIYIPNPTLVSDSDVFNLSVIPENQQYINASVHLDDVNAQSSITGITVDSTHQVEGTTTNPAPPRAPITSLELSAWNGFDNAQQWENLV